MRTSSTNWRHPTDVARGTGGLHRCKTMVSAGNSSSFGGTTGTVDTLHPSAVDTTARPTSFHHSPMSQFVCQSTLGPKKKCVAFPQNKMTRITFGMIWRYTRSPRLPQVETLYRCQRWTYPGTLTDPHLRMVIVGHESLSSIIDIDQNIIMISWIHTNELCITPLCSNYLVRLYRRSSLFRSKHPLRRYFGAILIQLLRSSQIQFSGTTWYRPRNSWIYLPASSSSASSSCSSCLDAAGGPVTVECTALLNSGQSWLAMNTVINRGLHNCETG